ncbi:myelin P2 protein-like [Sceloporus undulatus]|uniref:myelin P2 protein-like n=1 Tax=Sceloporus undulatus TaxID=8520 RepID=UPI001C4CCA6D|nr:myelin P2 protein-like [Sceloporus undulatus]
MLNGLNSCTSQSSTPSDVDINMPVKDVDITRRDLKCLPKPRLTIRTKGVWMKIKMENPVKKTEISFKLGQEFEEITADNRKTKSIVTMEKDGSLLHVQIWLGKKTLIRRRLVYGTMVEELIIGSAISKRQYKRA